MQARIAGYAAIAGGPLMLLSFPLSAPILFAFGALALLVALVGLSAAQGRRSPGVTWAAVVIPVVGLFVSIVGAVGMAVSSDGPFIGAFSPWDVWIVGTIGLVIGSALYATATLYVGVLSRSGAIALLAGSVAMTLVVLLSMAGLGEGGDTPLTAIASVAALVLFCAGWMWLGYAAAIRPRIEVSTGAS